MRMLVKSNFTHGRGILVENTESDFVGVDWILADNWWPYQRPTFVTPNFAGYVSGHSTYSRAAAEMLENFTGSPYFPGGLETHLAEQKEFLVFEDGPSEDIELQWVSYKDAADQCSLSRIWGGIHPYIDDIPGRLIGQIIGNESFEFGAEYFDNNLSNTEIQIPNLRLISNPIEEVALDCGSKSISKTFFSKTARAEDKFTEVVVFPTPPF